MLHLLETFIPFGLFLHKVKFFRPPPWQKFWKKIIHLFVFLIHSFVIYYSLICIFLFTCFYSCKALLNLILAPTCKTDYLVLICCFHRKLQFKEFSRNTIDLHVYYPRECNHLENLSKLKHNKNDKMPLALYQSRKFSENTVKSWNK